MSGKDSVSTSIVYMYSWYVFILLEICVKIFGCTEMSVHPCTYAFSLPTFLIYSSVLLLSNIVLLFKKLLCRVSPLSCPYPCFLGGSSFKREVTKGWLLFQGKKKHIKGALDVFCIQFYTF